MEDLNNNVISYCLFEKKTTLEYLRGNIVNKQYI